MKKQIDKKRMELYKILKEQDKRKDLSYKTDKELILIKEIKELESKLKEDK